MKSLLRTAGVALITGSLTVSMAWAGTVIAPIDGLAELPTDATAIATQTTGSVESLGLDTEVTQGVVNLGAGAALVGAAKVNIAPDPERMALEYPERFAGAFWETDFDKCAIIDEAVLGQIAALPDHIASTGSPWPENPDCIYQGGFGIGPMNPVTRYDETFGLWARSTSISDGTDTTVLTIIDGEGWFWDYKDKCDDCGSKQIAQQMAEELGIDAAGIVISATHAHSSPDFIGGWGYVPDWYMQQAADAIRQSIREAVTSAVPATIEVGEERARQFNSERRDTYYSAEEQGMSWFRAAAIDGGEVIATVGSYAAHPVTYGNNDAEAHPDWVGPFVATLEERFGGVGMHFMTGLGNMTGGGAMKGEEAREGIDPNWKRSGLAALMPEVGGGMLLTNTDIRIAQRTWLQPATNVPLNGLSLPGFFDRAFVMQPSESHVSKRFGTGMPDDEQIAPCISASPVSVEVPASAIKIGTGLALTAAPGEVFANLTNTLKERSGATVTIPMGQANDALGYMPQSFEHSRVGQQGLGFGLGGFVFVNYEDSYAFDHCVGDAVLANTLEMLRGL